MIYIMYFYKTSSLYSFLLETGRTYSFFISFHTVVFLSDAEYIKKAKLISEYKQGSRSIQDSGSLRKITPSSPSILI